MSREFRSANPQVAEQLRAARALAGPDLDPVTLALTLLLNRTTAALGRAALLDIEALRMSTTQFNVMTVLHRAQQPLTMGALAEAVSVRAPNLTSVVDALQARGLVSRTPSPDDRRSHTVATTRQGDAVMREFLPGHAAFMDEVYAGLDGSDRRALAALLDRLLASLQPDGEHRAAGLPDRVVETARPGS